MKKINELNVDELRQLKNIVLQYSTLDELVTAIDFSLNAIYYQDVPLNVRFDLNMFKELSIFTDNELKILKGIWIFLLVFIIVYLIIIILSFAVFNGLKTNKNIEIIEEIIIEE